MTMHQKAGRSVKDLLNNVNVLCDSQQMLAEGSHCQSLLHVPRRLSHADDEALFFPTCIAVTLRSVLGGIIGALKALPLNCRGNNGEPAAKLIVT